MLVGFFRRLCQVSFSTDLGAYMVELQVMTGKGHREISLNLPPYHVDCGISEGIIQVCPLRFEHLRTAQLCNQVHDTHADLEDHTKEQPKDEYFQQDAPIRTALIDHGHQIMRDDKDDHPNQPADPEPQVVASVLVIHHVGERPPGLGHDLHLRISPFFCCALFKPEVIRILPDLHIADLVHRLHAHDDHGLVIRLPAEEITVR